MIDSISTALHDVCHDPAPLHEPSFEGREWAYVKECLDSGWVSSVGKFVDRFEADLANFVGTQSAVAVVNGTAALHVALLLVGVDPGDEVLVPSLTFVASANAIRYCGAIPHFVESCPLSLGIDPGALSKYLDEIVIQREGYSFNRLSRRRIRAIVAVHVLGNPIDLDPLIEACARYNIELVEDAAESLGSSYKGRMTGGYARVGALSFNGNKVITTGGGGAVVTNDESLGRRAKHVTTTAKVPHPWRFDHDQTGFNYRLPNLNAALGCAQLEMLPKFLERKRKLATKYATAFAGLDGIKFLTGPPWGQTNHWLNAILLESNLSSQRDSLIEGLQAKGWQVRPMWTLLHRLPMFTECPRMSLETAEKLERSIICLPSGPRISP